MNAQQPLILFIDLFCGAGGVTTGAVRARIGKYEPIKLVACVNHDPQAIESHEANHPDTLHFSEDIRTLNLGQIHDYVTHLRDRYPQAVVVLWASMECTNYSKAKGGMPRDADSRTLPYEMFRYFDAIDPEYFYYENVDEFRAWGPLDKNGRPKSMKRGQDYLKWSQKVKDYGYRYEWRLLNAADFGAYTKRIRLFGIFAKEGWPINWPAATHSEEPADNMFGRLKPWKAVRDCLNFADEGKSLFTRKHPLVENTLKRIHAGLKKYVANHDSFLMKYYGNGDNVESIETPAGTIRTKDCFTLVQAAFIDKQFRSKYNHQSINEPAGSILTNDKHCLVTAWLDKAYTGKHNHQSIRDPAGVLLTKDKYALAQAKFGDDVSNLQPKDSDTPTMGKIKFFCKKNGIYDIRTRMLRVHELKRIQGFGDHYHLAGTKTAQKKFIGNSVPPDVVKHLMEALAAELQQSEKVAA